MSNIISKSLVLGEVTLERLGGITMPKQLASHAEAIATAFAEFKAAANVASNATTARANALTVVHTAAANVAVSVQGLADAVVVADPSKRLHPFKDLGAGGPRDLLRGSRGAMATKVASLAKTVAASKPRKRIREAGVSCAKAARALASAHAKLTPHKMAFEEARQTRDAALADFTLAYETARQVGKRIWKGKAGQFNAVFGPIESFRYSPKRRPAAAAAATTASTSQAKATTTAVAATASLSTPRPGRRPPRGALIPAGSWATERARGSRSFGDRRPSILVAPPPC